MKKRLLALLIILVMLIGLAPTAILAEGTENHAPVLKDGVSPTVSAQAQVNTAYLLSALQAGRIFTDPDGDPLNYKSYYYQRSTDGGDTWGAMLNFSEALFGWTTISLTETTPGIYIYRFYAHDGETYSTETWTLTLNVVEVGTWDTKFYVSRDQNYSTNGNKCPIIKLYKTAGVNAETGYDYVASFNAGGRIIYVYDPADYQIDQTADGWQVTYESETYMLVGYRPVEFTDSTFGEDAQNGTPSGTEVSGYNMFYAAIPTGAYSYRAYGYSSITSDYTERLGGMRLTIPTDTNVDGNAGGGTEIYLRVQPIYTNSKKNATDYFDAASYYVKVVCPIMGCTPQSGTPYVSGSYTYYPYMLYAGGNSCLYNYYVFPKEDYVFDEGYDNWSFGFGGNQTIVTGNTVNGARNISLSAAVELTMIAPQGADVGIYYQWNNFNTEEWACESSVDNGNGTVSHIYKISKSNGNWTWRASMEGYVTKAGWLSGLSSNGSMTITFGEGDKTDTKSHSFTELGSAVKTRDEADMMMNVDPSGFAKVEAGDVFRVRLFRLWEIIDSDAGNIMVEPDFNYQLLFGIASVDILDGGNATGRWLDVAPNGTAILSANYDAININLDNSSHGGFYPATNPERTAVFVLSDEASGTADANISYNKSASAATTRSADWDYNFDTWYYSSEDADPMLDFTVTATGSVSVSYAIVTTDDELHSTLSAWSSVQEAGGRYGISLAPFRAAETKGGTVIIKMMDDTGESYRLVRVGECAITAQNVTNPGEDFMPGDKVLLTFDGLYRGIHKISGVFNPTTFYLRYTSGEAETNGQLGQYQQMNRATITLSIPEDMSFTEGEDTAEYAFTNGYIFGSMYSAANPFGFIYSMTDAGVGTNFNAVTVNVMFSKLADAALTVHRAITYDVQMAVTDGANPIIGYGISLTDQDGNAVEPGEGGVYTGLRYGVYTYRIWREGYVTANGSFYLGAETESEKDADTGIVTKSVALAAAAQNAWDGSTLTEPAMDGGGVYQISTGAELAWFASAVNDGNNAISAALCADIDLAGHEWTPIGTQSKNFKGNFDGAGYRIYNLAINYASTATTSPYLGLFGYVYGTSATDRSVIKDVAVEGAITMTSTASVSYAYSAGLIGYARYAQISGCISRVDVTVKRISGNWQYVAGIAGYAYGTSITECANEGDINAYYFAAGITAYLNYGSKIERCYNSGDVTAAYNQAGGLTAYVFTAGDAALGANAITNSYNTGAVVTAGSYAGGVTAQIGANASYASELSNCFSTGAVRAGEMHGGAAIGYLSASDQYVIIRNVYYLSTAADKGVGTGPAVADAMTAQEIAAASFVQTLNTNAGGETAIFNAGEGYPILAWQGGEAVSYGDLNGDGEITVADALRVYQFINGSVELTDGQAAAADVNGDGEITAADALLVYRYVSGAITSFPVDAGF